MLLWLWWLLLSAVNYLLVVPPKKGTQQKHDFWELGVFSWPPPLLPMSLPFGEIPRFPDPRGVVALSVRRLAASRGEAGRRPPFR